MSRNSQSHLAYYLTSVGLLLLSLLVKITNATAICTVSMTNEDINAANNFILTYQPQSSSEFDENYLKIIFPAFLGLSDSGLSCTTLLGGSAFAVDPPTCTSSTLGNGDYQIQIEDLASGSISSYSVQLNNIVNPPAEVSNTIDANIGRTSAVQCEAYDLSGNALDYGIIQSGTMNFYGIQFTTAPTLTPGDVMNNVQTTMAAAFTTAHPVPISGSFSIGMPSVNIDWLNLGPIYKEPYIEDTNTITTTATYTPSGGSSTTLTVSSMATRSENDMFYIDLKFSNSGVIAKDAVFSVTVGTIRTPPSINAQTGFYIQTGDQYLNKVEYSGTDTVSLTTTSPTTDSFASATSTLVNQGSNSAGATDLTYLFTVYTPGDIPQGGLITLVIPSQIGTPSYGSGFTFSCSSNCVSNDVVPYWDSTSRILYLPNAYPDNSDYHFAENAIIFTLGPFTNPMTTAKTYITFNSYYLTSTFSENSPTANRYEIDSISTSLYIEAELGTCTVEWWQPTDNNTFTYGQASNWTMGMQCEHDIEADYTIKLTLPPLGFYVIDNYRCNVGNQSTVFNCVANNTNGTITISNFLSATVSANTLFWFNVDSIINPGWEDFQDSLTVQSITSDGMIIDQGTFDCIPDYGFFFKKGYIQKFTVTPQEYSSGTYPTALDFEIQPIGEVYQGSTIIIDLPDEVQIQDEKTLERTCAYDVSGFNTTSDILNCKVTGQRIKLEDGFRFWNSTEMTPENNFEFPTFKFSLTGFYNPSSTDYTSFFNVTILDDRNQMLYWWDPANTTYALTSNGQSTTRITAGPVIQMLDAATPKRLSLERSSKVNGDIGNYTFHVQSATFIKNNDEIHLSLPFPVYFSSDTKCYAESTNLLADQDCTVTSDLTKMVLKLQLPDKRMRRLQTGSLRPDEEFRIVVTKIKNPPSLQPTTRSITYQVFSGGTLLEQKTSGLIVTNTQAGKIRPATMSVIPSDFRQSFITNYTIEFMPTNYVRGMKVILQLPPEILFGANSIICTGLQGTDKAYLACKLNFRKKRILIDDAFLNQRGNPGQVRIQLSTLKNPRDNIITDSFKMATLSPQGDFLLDLVEANLDVNFFCQYPCATCNPENNTECLQCYGGQGAYNFFHQAACYKVCPDGWVNTTTNNCTECAEPCATCTGLPTQCDTCMEGYWMIEGQDYCRQQVMYPFPFIIYGFFAFFVILLSEIHTKTESRFKEAFIAFLSVPELMSWFLLTFLMYDKIGQAIPTLAAAGAILMYVIINFFHAVVHPRKIVPKSLDNYKALYTQYKCTTYPTMFIAYIFSFKYSLLLISYFWLRPRWSGDYSPANWFVFNCFSFLFLILPYPAMMAACGFFLVTDGVWSYAGFVAIEVMALSSILAILTMLDAFTVLRCRVRNTLNARDKVILSHTDYEDDGDFTKRKLRRRGKSEMDEFGADEVDDSGKQLAHTLNEPNMDEETRKQILLLEELAQQMREEKEHLRLEKERIEREKHRLIEDKETKRANWNSAMRNSIHQKITAGMEQNKKDIQETIGEKSNMTRRPYKDIEGEMEDYERFHESEFDETPGEQERVAIEDVAYGQIDYFRQQEGDDERYMQQVTPRAGGDSLIGQYDMEGEAEFNLRKPAEPIYDDQVTNPGTMQTEENYAMQEDAERGITQNMNREISDKEFFQDRSNAQIDVVTANDPANETIQYVDQDNAVFEDMGERKASEDLAYVAPQTPNQGYDDVTNPPTAIGEDTQFFAQEHAAKGETQGGRNLSALEERKSANEDFVDRNAAAYGSDDEKHKTARGETQDFFMEPPEVHDSTGHSESSEGIVDHDPFNRNKTKGRKTPDQTKTINDQSKTANQKANIKSQELIETANQKANMQSQELIEGPGSPDRRATKIDPQGRTIEADGPKSQRKGPESRSPQPGGSGDLTKGDLTKNTKLDRQETNKKRQIIYSDKSESSIEEMMGDTPSNYNLANGRLDGKSMGLKALLAQAQKHTGVKIGNLVGAPNQLENADPALRGRNLDPNEEAKFASSIVNRMAGNMRNNLFNDNNTL